jgi:STE24 endopeptidase
VSRVLANRRGLLHLAALGLVAAAVGAELARPLAPVIATPVAPHAVLGAAFAARARGYHDPRYLVALAATLLPVLVTGWWALGRRGRGLTSRIERGLGAHRPLRAVALAGLAVIVVADLVVLPLGWWAGYVQDGAYGFRTQGAGGWLRDWVVARAPGWLGVAIGLPLALIVIRRVPRSWPPLLGIAAAGLAALLTLAAPLLLEPLWLRTEPLPAGPHRTAVERVAAAADAPATRILVGDESRRSTKANAYVSGLGGTRRVVLYDTLLAEASPREVAIVVAHEFAHDRHRDLWRGVLTAGAASVAAAYVLALALRLAAGAGIIRGPVDPRAAVLALFVLFALGAATLPAQSALSRRAEAAADWAALDLTRDPAGFAAMQRTLARSHLSDPAPPRWARTLWFSHPGVAERLGAAAAWQRREGAAP